MPNRFDLLLNNTLYLGAMFVLTKTGVALDSAYVFGVSGDAVGYRFVAPTSGNLSTVYFFVTATTGTPGNLTIELRNSIAGNALKPNTTVHATQAVSPGTVADKWITCTFATPYAVTEGVVYWIVIADAAGSVGNNAAVAVIGGISNLVATQLDCKSSADGFATNGATQATPPCVLKFADGTICGSPFTTSANYASTTLERGIKLSGLTEDAILSGVLIGLAATNYSGLKIYSGATAPGGTPDLTVTFGVGEADVRAAFFADFTLRKNTVYRVVLTYGSASSSPPYYEIEDDATSADLTACAFGGGTLISTLDNGAGGWTDEADKFPRMALVFKDQLQIARAAHPFQGVFA